MTEKYIKDGSIGVLYSPGFGAGFSTWGEPEMAYDKDLVSAFIDGGHLKLREETEKKYPGRYLGGLENVEIEWVPQGVGFRISEYDGNESIEYQHDSSFTIA